MVNMILPHLQKQATKDVEKKVRSHKQHVQKKLREYVSDKASDVKQKLSGTKHKTERTKDYSTDMYAKLSSMAYEKVISSKLQRIFNYVKNRTLVN